MSTDPQDPTHDFADLMGADIVRHQHDKVDLGNQRRSNDDASSYRRQAAQQDDQQQADGLSDEIKQLVDPEQELIHATNGVQFKLMKKLRQGHVPWQAGLDLHGYSVDQARDELSSFIRDSGRNEYRCVLVVHGKALKHEQAPAVLKSYVNDWLRQLPQVLAFVSAQPKDGGTGALYVLLKRAK